jgi:hypothetical protein
MDTQRNSLADAALRQALGKDRQCAACGGPEGPGASLWPGLDRDNNPVLLHAKCLATWAPARPDPATE